MAYLTPFYSHGQHIKYLLHPEWVSICCEPGITQGSALTPVLYVLWSGWNELLPTIFSAILLNTISHCISNCSRCMQNVIYIYIYSGVMVSHCIASKHVMEAGQSNPLLLCCNQRRWVCASDGLLSYCKF